MKIPDFGLHFTGVKSPDINAIAGQTQPDVDEDQSVSSFRVFRTHPDKVVAYWGDDETPYELDREQIKALNKALPKTFRIIPDLAVPDSVPISFLAQGGNGSGVVPLQRVQRLGFFDQIISLIAPLQDEKRDQIRKEINQQIDALVNASGQAEQERRNQFGLAFDLLVTVSRIEPAAFEALHGALREGNEGMAIGKVYDPSLTPLVQLDDGSIFPISSLIVPASPHRNILKILQADQDRYGPLGNLLGSEGEQTVARLLKERLGTHCRVATNIPVKLGKQDSTDLDVVVYSPQENLLVVIEVKWHIQTDGTYEARAHEKEARKRQSRLVKRRAAIRSGTETAQWPPDWNIPNNAERRWFVVTNDVLPTHNLGTSDIKIRPFTLLKHMFPPGSSAEQLIALLDNPPTPPVLKRQNTRHKFGALTIYVEYAPTYGFDPESGFASTGSYCQPTH